MNTDTPRTNEALAAILERDRELSEKNAPEVIVKLCRAMECKAEELNHQLARSQAAGTIWYRRCLGEDAEWQLGELTKLTEERDELRDLLQEEQRLHIQTLNERDKARWRADTMFAKYVDILEQTRNERDDLAAALNRACANPTTGNWYREAQDALAAWKEARGES